MKKLNILSKTDGWSSGHTPVTLGTTVGSPSVHRRGTLLKLLFVLVLMVFGFGQMWGATTTYQHIFSAKPSTGNNVNLSSVSWNITATQLGNYNSSNYAGVQLGTKSASGSITLTSSSAWGSVAGDYKDKTVITEVRIWMNAGTDTPSGTVTIGGVAATDDGTTVAKNSSASSYTDATCVKYTPASNGNTGVVVITVSTSSKAGYICAMEIDCEEAGGGTPTPTLSSVAVSGTPTKTSYKAGQLFDPAGLVVTGTYSDASTNPITSGITWSYDPSQTLALNQTSIDVIATVNNIPSPKFTVTGLSVSAAPTYGLVTDDADLTEGDEIIIVNTDADKAISTEQKTNNRAAVSVSASNNVITPGDDVQVLTLGKSNDNWTLYTGEGFLYASSSSSNNMNTQTTNDANGEWTISIAGDGTVTAIAQGANTRNEMRYNPNNGSPIFSCYASTSGMGKVKIFKKIDNSKPKAPTFSIAAGDYETAQSVELSCETTGATIYYTVDGTTPTNESTVYSTAIPVSATTTIKAIAIKDNISSSVASATYTIIVWQTVADVWNSITVAGPLNAHIYGYVSQTNVSGFANNFYISDNGSTEGNQLYAYRMDMNSYSVEVGDKVKLAGDLTIHNETTKQFKYTSAEKCGKVIAKEAKGALQSVAVSGTPTKTEYASGEDFDPAGLKVYGTYANGFVGEITEGITWGNDLTDGKVTQSTTVHVTATVSGKTSPAYDVAVTVAAKTLVSIAANPASYTIYKGQALPEPTIMATYSEGEPADVSAEAIYDTESVFDNTTADTYTITVSYTFGTTKTTTYEVTVEEYANADDAPYTVTEALDIIVNAIGNTESADEIVVAGTVSEEKISNYKNRYKISDGDKELLVYNGKGFNKESFTDDNYPKVGDVVVVKGNVINYNGNTPEFATGKSYLLSQIRPATIAIEDVASFEVGTADLAVTDLTVTTPSDGDITLVSGDEAKATIIANAIHAVAPGTVTITANLAATENDDALNYAAATTTFSVTVKAATVKYSITFNGNGADGGEAPEFDNEAAAGANLTLPANTYTKTGYIFTGWKVYDENQDEVTVTAGAFEMPASDVTIKAQWEEISEWAYVYTSNVELEASSSTKCYSEGVTISNTEYSGLRIATGSAAGSATITVPAHATKLHFHVAGWKDVYGSIDVKLGESTLATISLIADDGINQINNNKAPYALANDPIGYYSSVNIPDSESPTDIVFEAPSGKRAVIFGVNQEGGVLPVLDRIEISGDLNTKTGYKAGDDLDLDGLKVEAIYTLNSVDQDPVDITSDPELELTYDPLVENQTSVTITASYKGLTDDITINGLEVASADPKIYVSTLNVNFASVEVGESVPAAETVTVTLTNVASVTATLGGTNADAFSVSPASLTESGDITISILANTDAAASYAATLTISDGEGGADDKTVNLSFAVTEPVVTEEYQLVSDVTSLAAGDQIIIVAENEGDYYTLDGSINNQYFPSTEVSIAAGIITAPSTSAIILGKDGDNWTMSMGGQLIGATAAKKASLGNNDASNTWTIAIAENVATIANTAEANGKLQFNYNNGTNPRFLNYASVQTAVAIYKKVAAPEPDYGSYQRGVTNGNYGTICLPKAGTISGATLFEIADRQNNTIYIDEIPSGELAAGVPYIFQAIDNQLNVTYTSDTQVAAGNANGLYGFYNLMDEDAFYSIPQNEGNYILHQNQYWLVNSDACIVNYRAYIKLSQITPKPKVPGRRRIAMTVNGTTGFDELNASEAPAKKVINGQLFILRGEKIYDATGRLVK